MVDDQDGSEWVNISSVMLGNPEQRDIKSLCVFVLMVLTYCLNRTPNTLLL